jgi:integrase
MLSAVRKRERGPRDYLFQPPGSNIWWIKLQRPGKRIERSLRTTNRIEAEINAAPLIQEHREWLLSRPRPLALVESWQRELEPGLHTLADGSTVFATERELHVVGSDGAVIEKRPNGGPGLRLEGPGPMTVHNLAEAYLLSDSEMLGGPSGYIPKNGRPRVARKDGDESILETYLERGGKHGTGLQGDKRREAIATWQLFRALTDNKPLKDCTRDDGRKLVTHLEGKGLASATIQRKLKPLAAAVNMAVGEGKLTLNPFAKVAPHRNDALQRQPFDDADIAAMKARLGILPASDQLLLHLVAATGMRLGEAFQIDRELNEKGVRFCIIGTKTESSKRRVPFPASVLPYLPAKVTGPLFDGNANDASKRLNKFIRDCGIADQGKVVHSFRHRAADRLRDAECPDSVRLELLGHTKTIAARYGTGSPVATLRKWIDKVGF